MSGTTPCISNPQKCEPSRPYPTCTSSAITTPACGPHRLVDLRQVVAGSSIPPALPLSVSQMKAAGRRPAAASSVRIRRTSSAYRVPASVPVNGPRYRLGGSARWIQSGRVPSARGLSMSALDTSSEAVVQPW